MAVTPDGIAIVPVVGTLVARSSYLGAASGLIAYSDIGEQIEVAATDPGIRAILLDVDSSGDEVGGLFDLVDHIQAIRSMRSFTVPWIPHDDVITPQDVQGVRRRFPFAGLVFEEYSATVTPRRAPPKP
jgi:hypothetical protein